MYLAVGVGRGVGRPQSFQMNPKALLSPHLSTLSLLFHAQQGTDTQPILRPSIHAVTKEVRGRRGRPVGMGSPSWSLPAGSGA